MQIDPFFYHVTYHFTFQVPPGHGGYTLWDSHPVTRGTWLQLATTPAHAKHLTKPLHGRKTFRAALNRAFSYEGHHP